MTNSITMKFEPTFIAAECSSNCNDKWCPYMHTSGWKIYGVEGLFSSKNAAEEHNRKLGRLHTVANTGTISLTSIESNILLSLTRMEQSAFHFWQGVLRGNAIVIPAGKVIRIEPKHGFALFTEYTWRLERKALSQSAIASGRSFSAVALASQSRKSNAWQVFR